MSGAAKSDKTHTQNTPFPSTVFVPAYLDKGGQQSDEGQRTGEDNQAEHTVKGWLTHYKSDDDSFDRPSSIDWDRRHLEVKHTQIDSFDTSCSIDTDSFGPELI